MITSNFSGVRILRIFTVMSFNFSVQKEEIQGNISEYICTLGTRHHWAARGICVCDDLVDIGTVLTVYCWHCDVIKTGSMFRLKLWIFLGFFFAYSKTSAIQ